MCPSVGFCKIWVFLTAFRTFSQAIPMEVPSDWEHIRTAEGCEAYMPVARGTMSDQWRPLIFRKCCPDLPPYFAPCEVGERKNVYIAEELVYPPYMVHSANLYPGEDSPLRGSDGYLLPFKDRRAKNFVYLDTFYGFDPPFSSWRSNACLGAQEMYSEYPKFDITEPAASAPPLECLAFLASPDSGYWQHFIDRVSLMYVQAEHLLKHCEKYLVAQPVSHSVSELWKWLEPGATTKITSVSNVHIKKLIFPCYSMYEQPYTILRSREIWMEAAGITSSTALQDKKVVLFLSRNHDAGVRNGGRQIVNVDEVIKGVEALLEERGRGEVLKIRDATRTQREEMDLFANEVLAVFGVHGSAFHHLMWMPPDTLVVEIGPKRQGALRADPIFFVRASALQLNYWALGAEAVDGQWNVHVNVTKLTDILRANLCKPNPSGLTTRRLEHPFVWEEIPASKDHHVDYQVESDQQVKSVENSSQ